MKRKKKNLCDDIDDVEVDFYKKKKKVSSVIEEVQAFCRSDIDVEKYISVKGEFNILTFWKDHEKIYPRLAKVTRFILASSAPAERSFSQAGWTINVRRT